MPTYVEGVAPELTFEVPTFGANVSVETEGGYLEEIPTVSFSVPPTGSQIRDVQDAANGTFANAALSIAGAVGASWDPTTGGPPWATHIAGAIQRRPFVISPFGIDEDDLDIGTVQTNGGIRWRPTLLPDDQIPDDQIGFEWLDEPGVEGDTRTITPTDVRVTLGITGRNHDDSTDTPIIGWLTDFVAQQPSGGLVVASDLSHPVVGFEEVKEWTTLGGEAFMQSEGLHASDGTQTVEVSLIDYVDDRHRVVIWTRGLKPGDIPLVQGDLSGSNNSDNEIDYGNRFFVDTQIWHYQPPPYRWVLPDPLTSPVLRHYPRDGDGRGWGGVTRGYPPPRGRRGYGGARQP
jgi:hypothetical protein